MQHGIDVFNDAAYDLCVPAVSSVWPRRWFPPQPGPNRKPGAPRYTGEYLDGFGNKITVHAVSNSQQVDVPPATLTHRATGYGILTFHRYTRKITLANWPRWVDPSKPGAKPYQGWPITIDQSIGEIVYTFRISGRRFTRVFHVSRYNRAHAMSQLFVDRGGAPGSGRPEPG